MSIILITGGNKGLGREAARRLLELGHRVYIGARNPTLGQAAAADLGAQFLPLDVTDDSSVAEAAAELGRREGRLDVLINNAGIIGQAVKPDEVTASDMQLVYDVNVFGIVRTTHAFLTLLRASDAPVIVNVSSGLGSFAVVTDPARLEASFAAPAYASSKAAVDMLTVQFAKGFPEIRINAADPGYTATDLNGNSGHQTVHEGTDAIVQLATIGRDGPTGTFLDRAGNVRW
jgi:NAD(P)-dependent dehydrogenase (short-subunit alcohol dehydrogenase family)